MERERCTVKAKYVMDYFVKGFEVPQGKKLVGFDWYFDALKGEVVFELKLEDASEQPESA